MNREERRRQAKLGQQGRKAQGLPSEPRSQAFALFERALGLHRAGKLAEAATLYRQVLALDPKNPDAHGLLGGACSALGAIDEGIRHLKLAIELDPANGPAYNNLGLAYRQKQLPVNAAECFERALALQPSMVEARINLAGLRQDSGDHRGAVEAYQALIQANPRHALAHSNLARSLAALGLDREAEAHNRRAVQLEPTSVQAWHGLGAFLKMRSRDAEAVTCFERVISLQPDHKDGLFNLANTLRNLGRLEEARAVFARASELRPDDLAARWGALMSLPILYENEQEIDEARERWSKGLAEIDAIIRLDSPEAIDNAKRCLVGQTNFNLHYQGRDDTDLQWRFGDLIHRVVAAAHPPFAQPVPRRPPRQKLRVGFLSRHFYSHTIPVLFGEWMSGLDRSRFEVHAFHIGPVSDATTIAIAETVDRFHGKPMGDGELLQEIRDHTLDALIYPDIGMDPRTFLPAALRLAPVQCMTWGHPVTSGLPTIDYFLTSELMEPEGAEAHYNEKLVRLPNLSICFKYPDEADAANAPSAPADRGPLYLCSQSLFKLLPQHDFVFARIARAVGTCRFAFLRHPADLVTEKFRARLRRAFAAEDLNADDFCEVRDRVDVKGFFALNKEADVVLDSIMWSGGRTALEAAACDKPIVTWPGPLMRARHSYAILKRLGIEETIAKDLDDYVAIAARLGDDAAWRNEIAGRVRDNKMKLYGDREPVRALEDFLLQVCRPA